MYFILVQQDSLTIGFNKDRAVETISQCPSINLATEMGYSKTVGKIIVLWI